MKTSEIIPFYLAHGPVEFPHTVPGPHEFVLEELTVDCKRCKAPLANAHGTKTDHRDCIDFLAVGLCERCRCVTQARFRVYSDGRLLHLSDHGWDRYDFLTRWDRFLRWLRSAFRPRVGAAGR